MLYYDDWELNPASPCHNNTTLENHITGSLPLLDTFGLMCRKGDGKMKNICHPQQGHANTKVTVGGADSQDFAMFWQLICHKCHSSPHQTIALLWGGGDRGKSDFLDTETKMQLWVHADRNLGKWNLWGMHWTSTGCLICDYFGDVLHQEFLAAGGGNRAWLWNYLRFLYHFCLSELWPSKQFLFSSKKMKKGKKKIKTTEAKKPKELCLIGTTLSLCQTNLTEFLDFHILAVCCRMVTAISFSSCSGMSAPALGVLLETWPSHILVWKATRTPWRAGRWHLSLVVRTSCDLGMDKWILSTCWWIYRITNKTKDNSFSLYFHCFTKMEGLTGLILTACVASVIQSWLKPKKWKIYCSIEVWEVF